MSRWRSSRAVASTSTRTSTSRATGATCACAASRSCCTPIASPFASARRSRCRAAWARVRRRTSRGCRRPRACATRPATYSPTRQSSKVIRTMPPQRCTAASSSSPTARPTRFDPPPGLDAVCVVPHTAVRTAVARRALPDAVPMADAVANVAHGALLTLGLARGDLELIGRGLHDRLHQPYRAHLFPKSVELLAARARARRDRRDRLGRGPDGALLDGRARDRCRRRDAARRERGLGRRDAHALRDAGRRRRRRVAACVRRADAGVSIGRSDVVRRPDGR